LGRLIELPDDPEAAQGMAFMRSLNQFWAENAEQKVFDLDFIGDCKVGKRLTESRRALQPESAGVIN